MQACNNLLKKDLEREGKQDMSQNQKTNTLSHFFPFHSLSEPLSWPLRGGGERDWLFTGERAKAVEFSFSGDPFFLKQATYLEKSLIRNLNPFSNTSSLLSSCR